MWKWIVRKAWGHVIDILLNEAFKKELIEKVNTALDIPEMNEDQEREIIIAIYASLKDYLFK